jgi:hypothetical protein
MRTKLLSTIVLALLLLGAVPIANGAYVDQYKVSPAVKEGMYAEYQIFGHPTIEKMRFEIFSVTSTNIILAVTETFVTHKVNVFVENYSVAQAYIAYSTDVIGLPLVYNTNPLASSHTSIFDPTNTFTVQYPIISPYLHQKDALTLDDKKSQTLFFVNRIGGDIYNFSYRKIIVTESSMYGYSYTWDGETGLLIHSTQGFFQPFEVQLTATNFWGNPLSHWNTDALAVPKFVFGAFFSHWELWALLLGGLALKLFILPWLRGILVEKKKLKMRPDLVKTLELIEKQEGKVKTVRKVKA